MSGYSEEMVGAGSRPRGKVTFPAEPFQSEVVAEILRQFLDG